MFSFNWLEVGKDKLQPLVKCNNCSLWVFLKGPCSDKSVFSFMTPPVSEPVPFLLPPFQCQKHGKLNAKSKRIRQTILIKGHTTNAYASFGIDHEYTRWLLHVSCAHLEPRLYTSSKMGRASVLLPVSLYVY